MKLPQGRCKVFQDKMPCNWTGWGLSDEKKLYNKGLEEKKLKISWQYA